MVLSLGGPDNLFQRLELSTMCLLTQWCSAAAGALTLIKPSHQHFYQSDLFPTKSRKCFTYHGRGFYGPWFERAERGGSPTLIGFHENGRKTNFEFRRALFDNEEKENAIAKIIRS